MTRVFKWSSNRSSKGFKIMPNQWLTVISDGNPRLKRWLSVISDGNPGLKWWLAITSDSNPLFKRKENTSPKRRLFLTKGVASWITLHSYTLGLMYASVHLLLHKKRNLLFIAKYFIFFDFSRKYLCKTWWYHESFRNQMV